MADNNSSAVRPSTSNSGATTNRLPQDRRRETLHVVRRHEGTPREQRRRPAPHGTARPMHAANPRASIPCRHASTARWVRDCTAAPPSPPLPLPSPPAAPHTPRRRRPARSDTRPTDPRQPLRIIVEDRQLRLGAGIVDPHFHQESVELRLRAAETSPRTRPGSASRRP